MEVAVMEPDEQQHTEKKISINFGIARNTFFSVAVIW
jgi:hypothetical protein